MSEREKYSLSRRAFLRTGALGASAVVLAACQPKTVEVEKVVKETVVVEQKVTEVQTVVATAAPQARTVKVWWEDWGQVYNDLMKPIGNSYMEEHPGVTVEWSFLPQWREKFLTALAAGDVPDATIVRPADLAGLAHDGAFLPLDAYFVQTGLKREDFVVAMYDSCEWDGKLYALPGGADFNDMYYNKDVFKDVGLDPEKPPVTLDELVEQSLKILKVDSNGAIERLGWAPGGWDFFTWLAYLFGGEWYDAQQRKILANHPKNVECLEWLKAYVDKLDVNQLAAFNQSLPDFWSPGNSFGSKKTAFRWDGYWTYETLDQYAPNIDYGICLTPTLKGTPEERVNYSVGGWLVGIPSLTKVSEVGWDFLNYGWVKMAWKMGCETLNGCCVMAQMDQYQKCVMDKLGPQNRMTPYFHVFVEHGKAATRFPPVTPVTTKLGDEVVRAYDFVVRGEKPAKAALDEVTDTVQKELDKTLGA